jgi:hypothetical protein
MKMSVRRGCEGSKSRISSSDASSEKSNASMTASKRMRLLRVSGRLPTTAPTTAAAAKTPQTAYAASR